MFLLQCCSSDEINKRVFNWPTKINRIYIGPDFWANRLQDWKSENGKLVCVNNSTNNPLRSVHLLTSRLKKNGGEFKLRVTLGVNEKSDSLNENGSAGFLIGAGSMLDYRAASLIHHSVGKGAGIFAGVDIKGRLFIQDLEEHQKYLAKNESCVNWSQVNLELFVSKKNNSYQILLQAKNINKLEKKIKLLYHDLSEERLMGNVGLISHPGTENEGSSFWFQDFEIEGNRFENFEDRNCGPIISCQHTLSNHTLKLTAQMMPLSVKDNLFAELQINNDGNWKTIEDKEINLSGFIAQFRVDNWNYEKDIPYRVKYKLKEIKGENDYFFYGTVKKEPLQKEIFTIAAFTGNHNNARPVPGRWAAIDGGTFPFDSAIWFPHNEIIGNVKKHNPDFLFFSGDQVYEDASPTSPDTQNLELDYLYKWYLWCWAFRDLTKDIPSVIIPDDHDVFHGNIWGASGKIAPKGLGKVETQDEGGYKYSTQFVNIVQETQAGHLPDPYDPTHVLNNIEVYYTKINYGGVSFAVIEDRKFKLPPKILLPKANIINGWSRNPNYDPKKDGNVKGAQLLGERQERFLNEWINNWEKNTWIKVVLSQTIFSNVATLPEGSEGDDVVPTLPVFGLDEYAENDLPAADHDSNAWPQTGRNNAIKIMRKGFAIHIAGDQHLGSTIQYGVDDWHDAGFAICVPSVANFWPRRWFPKVGGKNKLEGQPKYTGDFEDGFGNKMTVYAVANPHKWGKKPELLYDLSPGYGIIKLNKKSREIIFENWPRWADPAEDKPYPGWPVTINQSDNYGENWNYVLPMLEFKRIENPVVQIISEKNNEIIYTIRMWEDKFTPLVPMKGFYTIKVGESTDKMEKFENIKSLEYGQNRTSQIEFK